MEGINIAEGLLWYFVFLLSTTAHEAAHAFVAWRGGDRTAYEGGQVSLNPIPHVRREPIGMVVVPLLTALTNGWAIGWASTPYNPQWADRHPRRAAAMGAAGPAANLSIGIIAFVLLKVGLMAGLFVTPPSVSFSNLVGAGLDAGTTITFAGHILSIFLMLNVLLFAFNLLPFPPLDGASALGLVLPERAAVGLRNLGRGSGFSFIGILIAWKVFPLIAKPIFDVVLALLHPGASYH